MTQKKNIIYVSHAEKNPSGGGKIIYHHSEIVNNSKNYSSQVVHIKKKKTSKWKNSLKKKFNFKISNETGWQLHEIEAVKNFKFDWFAHNISIKNNLKFNPRSDFVILPEIFSHLADDLLIKKNIKYAIFVLNGYSIKFTNNESKLNKAYNNAQFILSFSNDITECIKLNFPKLKTKIIKIKVSVEPYTKNFKLKKRKLITYMSRKHPYHSKIVVDLLKKNLPKGWEIKDLNNVSETQVYRYLKQSKIFLSFSNLEGLALPPVEAALLRNKVIGYTGEGAKDYWRKPIFTEIYSGDLRNFVNQVISEILNPIKKSIETEKQLKWLKNEFSKKNEQFYVKKFLHKI